MEEAEIERVVQTCVAFETDERAIRSSIVKRFVQGGLRRPRVELIDDDALESIPRPSFLIDDVLPAVGIGCLWGPPGSGKTFLALDMSFSISTNSCWHGHAVKSGPVVYVVAEGLSGIGVRVNAWKKARGIAGRAGVKFYQRPVVLLDPEDVDRLIDLLPPAKPVLVILDTLARCMEGGEEDSARDMGLVVAALDRIQRAIGGFVLSIHHPTKQGKVERGSGALRGAATTMLRLKPGGVNWLTLECDKQKDAREFEPISLQVDVVALDGGDSSCVISSADRDREEGDALLPAHEKALAALWQAKRPLALRDWKKATAVLGDVIPDRTFARTAEYLRQKGLVEQTRTRGPYRLTEKGTATAKHLPTNGHGSSETTAATPAPLLEGAVAGGVSEDPSAVPPVQTDSDGKRT